MGSNEFLLCLKHHKKQTNQWITTTASNLSICGPVPRAATAVSRLSKHQYMPDMPQKAVPAKADLFTFSSVSVVVSQLIDKATYRLQVKIVPCYCVLKWRVFANLDKHQFNKPLYARVWRYIRASIISIQGCVSPSKTTITYQLKKYHDTIYTAIFYIINIRDFGKIFG